MKISIVYFLFAFITLVVSSVSMRRAKSTKDVLMSGFYLLAIVALAGFVAMLSMWESLGL